jgi:hypothetical protein
MSARIDFHLTRISTTADLSRALPDEALKRLLDIERDIQQCEAEQLEQAQAAARAAEISWARLASMFSSVGARPDPYRPPPMPTPDGRSKPWLQFARQLAEVRRTMKPLTFHLLIPLKREAEAQVRAIGPDVASILDRRVENVRALQDAAASADTLVRLSDSVPSAWPDPTATRRDLALEAVAALELAGRMAAFLDQNRKAVQFHIRAAELCRDHEQSERRDSNVISRVWAGIAAGEPPGEMLATLDFPFGKSPSWDPTKFTFLAPTGTQAPTPLSTVLAGRSSLALTYRAHDYGPAASLLGAEARVVRGRLHQNLGESVEARRLLEEAAACLERKSGKVMCPDRGAFVTTMMRAALLQRDGKPFVAELERLTLLTRQRALAMSYCETAALAFADVSDQKASRYRGTAKEIASM